MKDEYSILLYRGRIDQKAVDFKKKNIIGQALQSGTDLISLNGKIHLTQENGQYKISSFDPGIMEQIKSAFNSIKKYMEFFFKLKQQK